MDSAAMKAQVSAITNIIKTCTSDCINNFSTPNLADQEKVCLGNCMDRQGASAQLFQQVAQ